MDNNSANINDTNTGFVDDLNAPEINDKAPSEDDWLDDFVDFESTEESFNNANVETFSNSNNNIYYLDGYGSIYELDHYLNNGKGIIELLQHAKNKEQFNYILGISKEEDHKKL